VPTWKPLYRISSDFISMLAGVVITCFPSVTYAEAHSIANCPTIDEFLSGSAIGIAEGCEPKPLPAFKYCKPEALNAEELTGFFADGGFSKFSHPFPSDVSVSDKILGVELIKLRILLSDEGVYDDEKTLFLYTMYNYLFYSLLLELTDNYSSVKDIKTTFVDELNLRRSFGFNTPLSSAEIEQQIKCMTQCEIPGVSLREILQSNPFKKCAYELK